VQDKGTPSLIGDKFGTMRCSLASHLKCSHMTHGRVPLMTHQRRVWQGLRRLARIHMQVHIPKRNAMLKPGLATSGL